MQPETLLVKRVPAGLLGEPKKKRKSKEKKKTNKYLGSWQPSVGGVTNQKGGGRGGGEHELAADGAVRLERPLDTGVVLPVDCHANVAFLAVVKVNSQAFPNPAYLAVRAVVDALGRVALKEVAGCAIVRGHLAKVKLIVHQSVHSSAKAREGERGGGTWAAQAGFEQVWETGCEVQQSMQVMNLVS